MNCVCRYLKDLDSAPTMTLSQKMKRQSRHRLKCPCWKRVRKSERLGAFLRQNQAGIFFVLSSIRRKSLSSRFPRDYKFSIEQTPISTRRKLLSLFVLFLKVVWTKIDGHSLFTHRFYRFWRNQQRGSQSGGVSLRRSSSFVVAPRRQIFVPKTKSKPKRSSFSPKRNQTNPRTSPIKRNKGKVEYFSINFLRYCYYLKVFSIFVDGRVTTPKRRVVESPVVMRHGAVDRKCFLRTPIKATTTDTGEIIFPILFWLLRYR